MSTLHLMLATSTCVLAAPIPAHIALRQEITLAIKNLNSSSPEVRAKAEATLLRHSDQARQQLEEAMKDADPRVAKQAALVLKQVRKKLWPQADVHVVGLYTARKMPAVIKVEPGDKPIILVLCAYDGVQWHVEPAEGADIVGVIASGYNEQNVHGVDPTLVESYTYKGTPPGKPRKYFYAYTPKGASYNKMTREVKTLTGKDVESFQGIYQYNTPFQVGGEK
jgi:hypothetical protein